MPYIFYKESADTIVILDKKTIIEKEKVPLNYNVRKD
jgi:hypothetical protein